MLAGPNAGIENLHQKMPCNSADVALEHGTIALAEGGGTEGGPERGWDATGSGPGKRQIVSCSGDVSGLRS